MQKAHSISQKKERKSIMSVKDNGIFYYEHLCASSENEFLINTFKVKPGQQGNLAAYLKYSSMQEESEHLNCTYLVKDNITHELVGFFSLKAGMISVNERKIFWKGKEKETFDSIPAIELANFAVNNTYKESHPEYEGIGKIIFFDFIKPLVREVSEEIGVKSLYIYALPVERLIEYYKSLNFERVEAFIEEKLHKRLRPLYDEECIFMFQTL